MTTAIGERTRHILLLLGAGAMRRMAGPARWVTAIRPITPPSEDMGGSNWEIAPWRIVRIAWQGRSRLVDAAAEDVAVDPAQPARFLLDLAGLRVEPLVVDPGALGCRRRQRLGAIGLAVRVPDAVGIEADAGGVGGLHHDL